ncbi:hypothetical protein [Edaphobacter dinghuensis]|uniref:Uncharacterized protein n=1 Tax=Edaphobacter dinghuensis TaxID=1560005 RepID=A0A917M331_9BACT|nr:hypothetical protein [Edaphobacter dinghuensis]GGG71896.1 hypothetical protein GCM10011585_12720 [Edaphobacter dinghuensis]
MIDAIDELVARSRDHHELRRFHQFHRQHPEVLDFLVSEIRLRIEQGFEAFSYHSLWQYARWKLELKSGPADTYLMNDHTAPFYGRAIAILHPEFNGRAEVRGSVADKVFGTELEPAPKKRTKGYARRLRWADGKSLEQGWRPTQPHVVGVAGVNKRADIHPRNED